MAGPEPGKTLTVLLQPLCSAVRMPPRPSPWSAFCRGDPVNRAGRILDGPRVLANMSLDRWFPTRFSVLAYRLVIQNGILIMGGLSIVIILLTGARCGSRSFSASINVFITFSLSPLGRVRHWWLDRHRTKDWLSKLLINGVGLVLTSFILISMVAFKFFEGGWVTLLITGTLIVLAILLRRHYQKVALQLRRLDELAERAEFHIQQSAAKDTGKAKGKPAFDSTAKTAVLLVSGFNGTGLHTLLAIMRLFGTTFRNFVFLEIGQLDVGTFRVRR
jgi:K+ transporter